MIVILKQNAPKEKVDLLLNRLKSQGVEIHFSQGAHTSLFGLVGDVSKIDREALEALDIVEATRPVSEPYKLVNRKFHPEDTVISVGGAAPHPTRSAA